MGKQAVPLSSLGLTAKGEANPDITGIAVDSRQVKDGFLFAAMPGSTLPSSSSKEAPPPVEI